MATPRRFVPHLPFLIGIRYTSHFSTSIVHRVARDPMLTTVISHSKTRLSILADQESQPQAFRFSPRGPLSRAPRLWDRKPTAPANPRSRNREVWKRVLGHGNEKGMGREIAEGKGKGAEERGVKRMRVRGGGEVAKGFVETKWFGGDGEEEARSKSSFAVLGLDSIGVSWRGRRWLTYLLCVGKLRMELKSQDDKLENSGSAMGHELVTGTQLEDIEASISNRASGSARHHNNSLAYHHDRTLAEHTASTVQIPDTQTRQIHPTPSDQAFTVTLPPSLTQNCNISSILSPNPARSITETTLLSSPSSRLRYRGLEGDLAEVLSDFLSKAKAKREANSAAQGSENSAAPIGKNEDAIAKTFTDSFARPRGPRTPNRHALDILDKNTPSPALSPSRYGRTMVVSRSKTAAAKRNVTVLKVKAVVENKEEEPISMGGAGTTEDQEQGDQEISMDEEKEVDENKEPTEQAEQTEQTEQSTTATPSRRKPKAGKKRSPPRVRTINLRRPTGNEFVFQRTEAQELALKTRANTRKNKGKAKTVRAFLKEQEELKTAGKKGIENVENDEDQKDKAYENIENEQPVTPDRNKRAGKKSVHFDDDNLVSFFEEPETKFLSLDDIPTPTRRSKRKAAAPLEESATTAEPDADADGDADRDGDRAPLPLFSPSVPRKVRKLRPANGKKGVLTGSGPVKAKKVKVEA